MADPAVVGALGGLAAGFVTSATAVVTVRHQTTAARRESFGTYQQGRRAAYRELLLMTEAMSLDQESKIPEDKIEDLRSKYYEVYLGGTEDIEKALEDYWPAASRKSRAVPAETKRGQVIEAMAKHVRP